ncbi:MAG TPA: helix-turn-helix domain-containing protein [Candidatus Fimousia stercorigallinarum]|nr:helix-turn-helix domain-containing protein [Candidatus Fimousia stercorigallinarum]
MFIKREKPTLPSIFKNEKCPRLTGMTRSFDDARWFSNAHVHYHETELLFVAGGKAVVVINQQKFPVEKGDILVVERGCIHSVISDPKQSSDIYSCSLTDYQLDGREPEQVLQRPNLVPVKHAGEKEAFLEACWKELFSDQDRDDRMSVSICNLIAGSLVLLYYELFEDQEQTYRMPEHHFTQDILVFIYGHFSENITLERLAGEFHMSAGHISHEFSRAFGISPINYAINLRIDQAKWLLIQSELSIREISEEVGYQNIQHFAKIFQKRTGYLPLEYREKYWIS